MEEAPITVLISDGRGKALEGLKKSHMAVARSEVTELALSLLDRIPEFGLSRAWPVVEAAARGCDLMWLEEDLLFQSIPSVSTFEGWLRVENVYF